MRQIFAEFGNPAGVRRALEAAVPDMAARQQAEQDRAKLVERLGKLEAGQKRILKLVVDGSLTDVQISAQLADIKSEDAAIRLQLEKIEAAFRDIPSRAAIAQAAELLAKEGIVYTAARTVARLRLANHDFAEMTFHDKKQLLGLLFGGKLPDGRRMGIYVEWVLDEKQRFGVRAKYSLRGHLVLPEQHTLIHVKGVLAERSQMVRAEAAIKYGVTQFASP